MEKNKMNIKKFMLPVLLILTAVSSALIINSCDIKSPIEGIEVRLNTFTRETLVGTYFYDAVSRNAVSQNVKVTFTGANASKIVDETNETKTVFTAEKGILLFGIQDGTQFSQSSPFEVTVKLEASGFETKTEIIKIYSKGVQSYDLFMNNSSTTPQNADEGTTTAQTDNSGTTQTDVQVTTNSGETTVTIPAGTDLGNLSGNITVNVTTVPITSQNVYIVPQNLSLSNNSTIEPAATINVSIKDQNNNSSSSLVQISLGGIVNPRTGTEYQSGETVGFFMQNTTTGNWEKVGEGTATSPAPGTLGKTNKTNVIGGAVVAGAVIIMGNEETTCQAVLTITNIPSGFNKSSLRFFNSEGKRMNPSNSGSNFYFEIPEGGATVASVRINADLNNPFNTGTELGSNIALTCGSKSTTLNFPSNLVGVQFDITGICTARDPQVVVFPNATFSYRKKGTQTWQGGSLVNGKASITGLEVGATYEVTASYRGNTGNAEVRITSSSAVDILQISNPENLLSSSVDASTVPQTVKLTIDIGNECD